MSCPVYELGLREGTNGTLELGSVERNLIQGLFIKVGVGGRAATRDTVPWGLITVGFQALPP